MKYFTAVVEVSRRGNMSGDEVDQVMDRLAGQAVSLSVSRHGYQTARITLPADNVAQAATGALLAVTHGFGTSLDDVVHLELAPEEEADRRDGHACVPELVGVTEAAELLDVSPQAVRQMIDSGRLAAHKVGDRSWALVKAEVLATAVARAQSRRPNWESHPGLRGLLKQLHISMDRVLPSPKIDQGIENDGPYRARSYARYQFTVLGGYPGEGRSVERVAHSDQEVTVFDEIRRGEWSSPD